MTAQSDYIAAHLRAIQAMDDLEGAIHDMPAPDGDTEINYAHVGDMARVADMLEQIVKAVVIEETEK